MLKNDSIENIALNLKHISEILESSSVVIPLGTEDDDILNLIRFFVEKVSYDVGQISNDLYKLH